MTRAGAVRAAAVRAEEVMAEVMAAAASATNSMLRAHDPGGCECGESRHRGKAVDLKIRYIPVYLVSSMTISDTHRHQESAEVGANRESHRALTYDESRRVVVIRAVVLIVVLMFNIKQINNNNR